MKVAAVARPDAALPADAGYPSSVADRVARLNVVLKRQLASHAKQHFDLTIVETRLVLLLKMFAPISVNDLANRSDIDRTQISKSITVLAERGLVLRRPGPVDRRETLLGLTRRGVAVHDKILAELYRRNQDLIAGIPEEALAGFFKIMDLLIARARGDLAIDPAPARAAFNATGRGPG